MTEQEWIDSDDPRRMIDFLPGKASGRKLRLFACACLRRVGRFLVEAPSLEAVALAERFADGLVPSAALTAKRMELNAGVKGGGCSRFLTKAQNAALAAGWPFQKAMTVAQAWTWAWDGSRDILRVDATEAARQVAVDAECAAANDRLESIDEAAVLAAARTVEKAAQAVLLRCIVGPIPFRPVTIDRSWLAWNDGIVPRLAEAVYEERLLPSGHLDPHRLGVLADALEDAGADAGFLGHLRSPGSHVRGCWALDLLLGKG